MMSGCDELKNDIALRTEGGTVSRLIYNHRPPDGGRGQSDHFSIDMTLLTEMWEVSPVGRKAQKRPKRLARKLALIGEREGITQADLAARLRKHGAERTTHSGYVTDFESGRRIPSLFTLLAYARIGKTSTDSLIDDALDLPK